MTFMTPNQPYELRSIAVTSCHYHAQLNTVCPQVCVKFTSLSNVES